MGRSIALALVLAGCGGPVPVYLVEQSARPGEYPVEDPTPEAREVLDEAFGFWGRGYDLVPQGEPLGNYGAVQIVLDDAVTDDAWTQGMGPCRPLIWSLYDADALIHELGHVWLGPDHSEDPDNLMHAKGGEDVTDKQWDKAQRKIDLFNACLDGA